MPGRTFKTLAEAAFERHGYLTPETATELGIDPAYLRMLARRGELEHPARGIYRLPLVPRGPFDEYMEAVLWPRALTAVICNETALDIYELCDIVADKIHITVPTDHKIQREIPARYVVHHADLKPDEVTVWQGLPIVTIPRAILECIDAGVRRDLLVQAIDTARAQGQLRRADVARLRARLREQWSGR